MSSPYMYKLYDRRSRPVSGYYSDDDRPSTSPSSYSSCDSVEEVFERYREYKRRVQDMVSSFSELDDNTVINQGTSDLRQPLLGFHHVYGNNIVLLRNGRVARRKESFCKGLAFSNRPIAVDENVCIRLNEVATNWSGVLRFGVTNVDPETYRTIPVPKFACPDLTSKEGYWAKALPERYSVSGHILHFYVNSQGELYYGVNGVQKGVFLVNINVSLPLWVIVDIYGNSVEVEFLDPNEFRTTTRSSTNRQERAMSAIPRISRTNSNSESPAIESAPTSSTLLPSMAASTSSSRTLDLLRFHHVTGRHVNLNAMRTVADRREQEYTQGYVFTERPIRNNEKIVIQVVSVQQLYNGGLAFGLTCCDPSTLCATDLPDDSNDLIEMPQYWVSIKDIALQPRENSMLSFWVMDNGEVKFQKDSAEPRTVMHVDNSLPLYAFFDIYGSTQSIRILGTSPVSRSISPIPRQSSVAPTPTRVALPPPAITPRRESSIASTVRRTEPVPLRVNLRGSEGPSSSRPVSEHEENLSALRITARPEVPTRRTVDDLLSNFNLSPAPPAFVAAPLTPRLPPPIAPRPTVSTPNLPPPPARPPPPTPSGSASSSAMSSFYGGILSSTTPTLYSSAAPTAPPPTLPPSIIKRTPPVVASAAATPTPSEEPSEEDECSVCMSARINSVIYKCGHQCMCYECALQTSESSGVCPICRNPITDVIKCFRS